MHRRRYPAAVSAGILLLAGLLVSAPALLAGGDEGEGRTVHKHRYVLESGDGAYLGVNIEEETGSDEGGARVVRVVEDSPAAEAGLKVGDVIVGIESHPVRGPGALSERIRDREPGDVVALKVVRDGRRLTLTATLGERPGVRGFFLGDEGPEPLPDFDEQKWEESSRQWEEWAEKHAGKWEEWAEKFGEQLDSDDPSSFQLRWYGSHGGPRLGVQLVETTPELREHLGGPTESGVLVSKVLEDTPAEKAGLLVGDLIVSASGDPVEDAGDLVRAVHRAAGGALALEIVRDGRRLTLEAVLPATEEGEESSGFRSLHAPGVIRVPDVRLLIGDLPTIPVLPDMPEIVLPNIPDDVLIRLEDRLIDADEVRRELERHRDEIEAQRWAEMTAVRDELREAALEQRSAHEALREAAREREDAERAAEQERHEALERIRRELQRTLADDGLIVI